jgi:predicted acylesterase/phospholipase RssA
MARPYDNPAVALESLDPFNVRRRLGGAARVADLDRLMSARRTLLPLPMVDRPQPVDTEVFGAFEPRPIASLRGKRIGVVAGADAGAGVALVGVMRAFEEAGIEPEAIGASGWPAVWAAMWAAGLGSEQIADLALRWRPQDHLGTRWAGVPRFAAAALRGFAGPPTAEALEALFDRRTWRTSCGSLDIALHTPVYELDHGLLHWFGTAETPDLTVGELARIAVAGPARTDAVRVEGMLCVDGGFVDGFPAEPLIADGGFDRVFALDHQPDSVLEAGFQGTHGVREAQRAELASRSRRRLGERLSLVAPISPDGDVFFATFIDRRHWPDLMRSGYTAAVDALAPFRRRGGRAR